MSQATTPSVKQVVESQQKTTQDMSERFKGDADRIMALSREYVQKGQQLVHKNMSSLKAGAS